MTKDNYAPHELRVIEEKKNLDEKIEALRKFIADEPPKYQELEPEDKRLLNIQYGSMIQYSLILGWRIERFHLSNTK